MIDFLKRKEELEARIAEGEKKKAEIDASLEGVYWELKAIIAAHAAYNKEMGKIPSKLSTGVKKEILSQLEEKPLTEQDLTEELPDVKPGTSAEGLLEIQEDGTIVQ